MSQPKRELTRKRFDAYKRKQLQDWDEKKRDTKDPIIKTVDVKDTE